MRPTEADKSNAMPARAISGFKLMANAWAVERERFKATILLTRDEVILVHGG
jgi:hypothetical protein